MLQLGLPGLKGPQPPPNAARRRMTRFPVRILIDRTGFEITMPFTRVAADSWHREVPGSRWFKADLHVHTLDDLPGGRIRIPEALVGNPEDPARLEAYARLVLRSASRHEVQVIRTHPAFSPSRRWTGDQRRMGHHRPLEPGDR